MFCVSSCKILTKPLDAPNYEPVLLSRRKLRLLNTELQPTRAIDVDTDILAIANFAAENQPRNRCLHLALDRPLEWTGAIIRIIPGANQKFTRAFRQLDLDMTLGETLPQTRQLDLDDLLQVLDRERVEHDSLIHAIQKLRTEVTAQFFQYAFLHPFIRPAFKCALVFENPW